MSSVTPSKPKSKRQDLLTDESLKTFTFSVKALARSAVHPYVLDKFKKCVKPILLATAVVYFAGLILLAPIEVIAHLAQIISLGAITHDSIAASSQTWLKETVSLVPFLALFVLRSLMRKPLFKCFIHLLREINPATAVAIETATAKQEKSGRKSKRSRFFDKMVVLIGLELVLHIARKSPLLGRPAVVATHFFTMKKVLGRDRAIALSLFGLVPYVEPWLLRFVQLWRSSNILGQEILSDYTNKFVPPDQRSTFYKNHDVDIPIFALPGSLLLQIPIVGPLFFIPVQASAAFLVDKIARANGNSAHPQIIEMVSPTLPNAPHPSSTQS